MKCKIEKFYWVLDSGWGDWENVDLLGLRFKELDESRFESFIKDCDLWKKDYEINVVYFFLEFLKNKIG